jgi:DNA-directed RNA polymerase subunit RPC12/RpoP
MSLAYACAGCGRVTEVPEHCAGKRVRCKNCGVEGRVPSAARPAVAGPPRRPAAPKQGDAPDGAIVFACAACGRAYRVAPDLAGRTVRCKDCGAPVPIPAAPSAAQGVADAPPIDEDIYGLADPEPAPIPRRPTAPVASGPGFVAAPDKASSPRRARRSRWLADATDHEHILNRMCFYGMALVVGGFVIWLLAINGIVLRSRAARIMNRPGDLGAQALIAKGMAGLGALAIVGAFAGAGLGFLARRELPPVSAMGLVGWVISLPIAFCLVPIMFVAQGGPGP